MSQTSKNESVVKSIANAVVATAIVESGLSLGKTIVRQPVVVFGLGVMLGYFTHKYRKEIIAISCHTAEQSKDFIKQQKNNINNLLVEAQNKAEQ
jgi:hypothetical protein